MQDHKKTELSNDHGVSFGLPSPCYIWQNKLKVENSLIHCGGEGMAEQLGLWRQELVGGGCSHHTGAQSTEPHHPQRPVRLCLLNVQWPLKTEVLAKEWVFKTSSSVDVSETQSLMNRIYLSDRECSWEITLESHDNFIVIENNAFKN